MKLRVPAALLIGVAACGVAIHAQQQVTFERILRASQEPQNWLTYSGSLAGHRYTLLTQITPANVRNLELQWVFQTRTPAEPSEKFEATPLVVDGVMYTVMAPNHVVALDAATGRMFWMYSPRLSTLARVCCGRVNRGLAILGETLFMGTIDGHLIAIDAKNGKPVWDVSLSKPELGYSFTMAPLIVKDKVIMGPAGGEYGIRGFIAAFDAKTGREAWRFNTVPGPGEPGHDTWPADSDAWQHGGGSIWTTGAYDAELNLLYFGTGNPGPDWNADPRPGDNLYTDSVVALDPDTGTLKWHYQFTPHDVHDWDAISDPVLVDLKIQGRPVKALIQANRNGFFYTLDRTNGKVLVAKAYTKVTWAKGIGADGRPILIPGQAPTEEGNRVCPGLGGGHNWQATAYSPQTGLYYFPSSEDCHLFYKTKQGFTEGQWYQASTVESAPKEHGTGEILAVDPVTGDSKWRFDMVSGPSAGILATAGGLVFSGDGQGYLFALDARTGKVLWKFQTGGGIGASPISYSLDGKQYIAVAAGGAIIAFGIR